MLERLVDLFRHAIQLEGFKRVRETELEVKTLETGSVRGWESADVQKPLTQAGAHHRGRESTNDDKVSVDCMVLALLSLPFGNPLCATSPKESFAFPLNISLIVVH